VVTADDLFCLEFILVNFLRVHLGRLSMIFTAHEQDGVAVKL
jgi:hypothetical protein